MPIIVPELETDRLILRPFCEDDLAAMVEHLNDEEVVKHTANIPFPYGWDEARYFLDTRCRTFDEYGFGTLAIVMKADRRWMGSIGLVKNDAIPVLGYMLGRAFWGQGVMSEAVTALIDFHDKKNNWETIKATVDPDNDRSSRLLEKLGFRSQGHIIVPAPARGGDRSVILYHLHRDDWRRMHG